MEFMCFTSTFHGFSSVFFATHYNNIYPALLLLYVPWNHTAWKCFRTPFPTKISNLSTILAIIHFVRHAMNFVLYSWEKISEKPSKNVVINFWTYVSKCISQINYLNRVLFLMTNQTPIWCGVRHMLMIRCRMLLPSQNPRIRIIIADFIENL